MSAIRSLRPLGPVAERAVLRVWANCSLLGLVTLHPLCLHLPPKAFIKLRRLFLAQILARLVIF